MSFSSELKKGIIWTAINKYSSIIIQLVLTAILARLISPSDYGILAVVGVLLSFMFIFAESGIGPAIIQQKEVTQEELDDLFTLTFVIGAFLSLIFFFCSDFVAAIYENSQLILYCRLLSLTLFFNTLQVVPSNLFFRDKRFNIIAKRNFLIQLLTGIIAVVYAYCGGGGLALVFQSVLSSFLYFCVSLYYYPCRIKMRINSLILKKIFSFSAFQFLFTLLNFFSRNIDKLIIGKYLNMQALGYYQKSYALMMQPMDKISDVITPVLQPVFSDYQNDKEFIVLKYFKLIKIIGLISFPLGVFLFFNGSEIIHIVFGDNWDPAVTCFKILSLSLPLQMICTTTGSVYQSCNSTSYMFWTGLVCSLVTIMGFLISLSFFNTIEALATSWTITMFFTTIVNFSVLCKCIFKVDLNRFLCTLIQPIVVFWGLFFILLAYEYYFCFSDVINILLKTLLSLVFWAFYGQLSGQYNILKLKLDK